ncbi:hypothetical protein B0I35DRAFT_407810 [Stachybotrys elegans]|uniref:Carrier domain-containing protein n=1 Tax=Stachybotrys elegans TaxID=80388 RepID=A0A8K0WT37_9HYPO|nr:hypothetical protein B0I35DRAFT_407810 [Stachybotrys elegans]
MVDTRTFCIQIAILVSTFLRALWAMIIRVYCYSQQIGFGHLVSGREASIDGIEKIISPFLNLIVYRIAFYQASSERSILQNLQVQLVAGLSSRLCPLADILHSLESGGQTLLNTVFSFPRFSNPSSNEPEGFIQFHDEKDGDPTELDLAIDVEDPGNDVTIILEQWRDYFSPGLAGNITGTYTQAILAIMDRTDEQVRLLNMASPESLDKICLWNKEAPRLDELYMLHVFENAPRQPGARAVRPSSKGQLRYPEPDTASSRLVSRLRAPGVARNALVPLILIKSIYSFAGILAILKAGDAAGPFEPEAPQQRLVTIALDAETQVSLSSPQFQERLSSLSRTVVSVSASWPSLDQQDMFASYQDESTPSDSALVIFKSSSIGAPKGSILEHALPSTSALSQKPHVDLRSKSHALQSAAYAFDVSIEEACFAMMNSDCNHLAGAMTTMQVTPMVASMITPQAVPSLKRLDMGSETLTRSVTSVWAGQVQLLSTYGSSECSVAFMAMASLTVDAHGAHIAPAVGSLAWFADPGHHHLPVPVGAVSELVIEEKVVAHGYLNNEVQTPTRLIASAPWVPEKRKTSVNRLDRSSDLIRLEDDTSTHFVKRHDGRAKLHQRREIEHQFLMHQNSDQQVVVDVLPISLSASRKALVPFFTTTTSHYAPDQTGSALMLPITKTLGNNLGQPKQTLALALPPQMALSIYTPLRRLPRNTSGKTDDRAPAMLVSALPEDDSPTFALAVVHKVLPTTKLQPQLQKLRSDTLSLDTSLIPQNDHFFQFGGDSVSTIHPSTTTREQGLSSWAGPVFQHPTLQAIPDVLQHMTARLPAVESAVAPYVSSIPLKPTISLNIPRGEIELLKSLSQNIEVAYPSMPLQEGLLALTLRGQSSYTTSRTYEIEPTLNAARFQRTWQQLADDTFIRTSIFFTSSMTYQVVVANNEIAWPSSASLELYRTDDDARPVEEGQPLARYGLTRQEAIHVYYVWTVHHALYDGWSDSLVEIYHGEQQQLMPFSYFVEHIRERDPGATDSFLTKHLTGASAAPFPSISRPTAIDTTQPRGLQTLEVSLPHQQGQLVTTTTLLKATCALALFKYTDSMDVAFGLTLSGRDIDLAGIEVIPGPAIATVPLSARFDQQMPASQLLARVQSETVETINYHHEGRLSKSPSAIQKLEANTAILATTVARLPSPHDAPSVKTVFLTGEAPQANGLALWVSHASLANTYNPAGAAIIASVQRPYAPDNTSLSIGHTLPSNSTRLVRTNNRNHRAAVGTVGELLIEGPILTEGYIDNAQKTAESFIYDPGLTLTVKLHSTTTKSQRFYETSDLSRYAEDGSLFYTDRKDTQIKIHGQRAEIGEIEMPVRKFLPTPLDIGTDTTHNPDNGRSELSVYLQPTRLKLRQHSSRPRAIPQSVPSVSSETMLLEVRDKTQVRPAGHMVPSLFVPLSSPPKTQNGKAKRKTLKGVGEGLSAQQRSMYSVRHRTDPQPPSTPAEAALQQLSSSALGISSKQIGADNNFPHLGGGSLSATQLAVATRTHHVVISTQNIFRHSKLSDMARVTHLGDDEQSLGANVMSRNGNDGIGPFSLITQDKQTEALLMELKHTWHLDQDIVEDLYPTAPLQEGLLAATMKARDAYINREVYQIPKNINIDRFTSALESLIHRNSILRTSIAATTSWGSYRAVVQTPEPVARLRVQGLQAHLQTSSYNAVGQLGERLATATILQDAAGRNYFLSTAHYSVYDDWIMDLFWKEMELAVPCPLASFVAHLQNRLRTQAIDDFWREYLSEALPTTFPEPISSLSPSHQPSASESLSHTVYLRHESPASTLPTVIRAAWALLISSYADDRTSDVVFNVMHSGRNADIPDISDIMGPTITTHPVRVRWDDDATVGQFLADVQSNTLDLIPYEHTGLQRISELNADRKASCESNSILVIHPANLAQTDRLGLRRLGSTAGADGHDDSVFLNYGLATECKIDRGAVHVRASYDTNMIPSYQVGRIVNQLDSLIQQLCAAAPHQLVRDLDKLSHADRQKLKELHNQFPDQTVARSLPSVLAQMVAEAPDALAVDSQIGLRLTYAELERLSDIPTHDLVSLGVRPDDRVAWCSGKSPWTVVGLIAIIKSGATAIFLDASHPPSRRRETIEANQPHVILAIPPHDRLFSADDDMPAPDAIIVPLNVNELMGRDLPQRHLVPTPSSISKNNGLYFQFTSGSSGTPKGRVVEHGSFPSSTMVYTQRARLNYTSRVHQLSSYNSDSSLLEMLGAPINGACVCVPLEEARHGDLATSLNHPRISWSVMTPSLARTLPVDSVPTLRALVLTGEAVSPMDLARWSSRLSSSSIRLDNKYGPSEGSIFAYVQRKDTQVKIRGQRAELDEIEHHLLADNKIRGVVVVYPKTGRFKGQLVAFVSFVAAPERSETLSSAQNGGREAVSLLPEPEVLAASLSVRQVKTSLSRRLPSYMIPTIWVPLIFILLLVSGKANRRDLLGWLTSVNQATLSLLTTLGLSHDHGSNVLMDNKLTFTPVEEVLRAIWSKVLGLPEARISLDSSFSRLGGNSISAMQVVSLALIAQLHLPMSVMNQANDLLSSTESIEDEDHVAVKSADFEYWKMREGPNLVQDPVGRHVEMDESRTTKLVGFDNGIDTLDIRVAPLMRPPIPDNGLLYFISRFLAAQDAAVFRHRERTKVLLNYLGSGLHGTTPTAGAAAKFDKEDNGKEDRGKRTFSDSSEGGRGPRGNRVRRFALFGIQVAWWLDLSGTGEWVSKIRLSGGLGVFKACWRVAYFMDGGRAMASGASGYKRHHARARFRLF